MSKSSTSYHGLMPPMVTPLTARGEIDQEAAVRLLNFLHHANANPFVLGTTGEGSSVAIDQREVLVKLLVCHNPDHLPTTAAVLGLPLADTVRVANRYLELGINAVVLTLPNYFELTPLQMTRYLETLADQIDGNLILYNIPKTVHMSIPLEVADELSQRENVIGIKDSEPGEARLIQALRLWRGREDFFHFVGSNALMCQGLLRGSRGIVPSTANLFPQLYQTLIERCEAGETEKAEEIQRQTNGLCRAYQQGNLLGESLAILKQLLAKQGLTTPHMVPPLLNVNPGRAIESWKKMSSVLPDTYIP